MKPWLDRWNAYWFPETTTLNLSVCRIIVVAAQLFLFLPSLEHQVNLLEKSGGFIEPQILIRVISLITPNEVFFRPAAFTLLYWVTIVAGILCLAGLFTRPSAFTFALGNWLFIAHAYSYGEEHHNQAILCIFLMLLAFSPSGDCLSVDALIRRRQSRVKNEQALAKLETAIWPLKLVQVLLALTYFSTGLAKILYGGISWMNGYTLQQYMFSNAVSSGRPLGVWLAQQHTLCIVLSIATILFELFFFVALVIPSAAAYFVIGGILLHAGIYVTMGANFFQHMVLYAVFIDFEHIISGWQRTIILGRKNMFHLARHGKGSTAKA